VKFVSKFWFEASLANNPGPARMTRKRNPGAALHQRKLASFISKCAKVSIALAGLSPGLPLRNASTPPNNLAFPSYIAGQTTTGL
jgi:hypothetical protein